MKLSFIVPIYNVEKYLRKCVDSLLAQDYSDCEIVLVDDGSPDGCPAICNEYASRYPFIRVIHQPNAGLSAARNAGVAVAQGEYVCFVDSDDYWEPNMLSPLMAQIERDCLDVLRFNYRNINEAGDEIHPNKDPKRYVDYSPEVCDGLSFLNNRQGSACYTVMYILRRTLLTNCLFTPGIYFEDTDWTPRMLLKADRVASTDKVVYNYLIRQGSITQAVSQEKKRKVLDDKMRLIAALKGQKKNVPDGRWFDAMIAGTVISVMGLLSGDFYSERKAYLCQLKALDIYPLTSYQQNKGGLRKIRLINLSPSLAVWLLNLKNRKS